MKSPSKAVFYAHVYPILADLARQKGYSLALHGSMQRDLDLVAIPWTDDACSAENLMEHLAHQIGIFQYLNDSKEWSEDLIGDAGSPTQKPHGRVAYLITLKQGTQIDLSIMPRKMS